MYRVYDTKKECWVNKGIYLSPNDELYLIKRTFFGNKLIFLDNNRYVLQQAIELQDKYGIEIYIGDYLEAQVGNNKIVRGMVTFAPELSSYIILCFDTNEYFVLGQSIMTYIKVIGNVFDDA